MLKDDRSSESISILVAMEVWLYRDALVRALSERPEFRATGTVPAFDHVAERIRALEPQVVLLDLGSKPDLAIVLAMTEAAPGPRFVALGIREEEADVLRCVEMGLAYVPREATFDELIAVIRSAAKGELHCSPRIAASLFRRVAALAAQSESSESVVLTDREQEIAHLLTEGLTNKQIAWRLQIGLSTVKNHVHRVLRKFNAPGRAVVAARARGMWGYGPEYEDSGGAPG